MNIDVLLEKWLTAFKKYGHMVEIFENPSIKEFNPVKNRFRFILDAKRNKAYIWNAMGALHSDAWIKIKKELNDPRHVYKSGDLLTGTVENGVIHIYAAGELHQTVREKLKNQDWSFAKKYIYMKELNDVMDRI